MSGEAVDLRARVPINIRAATPADIPAILEIEQQAPEASHWSAREYQRIVANEVLLVAEIKKALVGFVCAKRIAGEWELDNLAVAPAFRRRNIARELLRFLIAHAQQSSATAVFLEVRESNLAARRFYEKHGFLEVGRRPQYYHQPEEDAVLYKLRPRELHQ